MKKAFSILASLLLLVGIICGPMSVASAEMHKHGGYKKYTNTTCAICGETGVTSTYSCSSIDASPKYTDARTCYKESTCAYRTWMKKTCYNVSDGCHSHNKYKNYHAKEHLNTSHNIGCAY